MKLTKWVLMCLLCVATTAVFAQNNPSNTGAQWELTKRTTLAIKYPDKESSEVDMRGTGLHSNVTGRAEVKYADGRTRIKLRLKELPHPQTLGSFFTTFVVWAITPDGQADNLGELQTTGDRTRETEVTTPHQTFALVITAEPHGLVKHPSPNIIAENLLRKDTKGNFTASNIEYRGDPGLYYTGGVSQQAALAADFQTPLSVLGARRAVEIAHRAGAQQYADAELSEAEKRLATLEQVWPRNRHHGERFNGEAREVMRLGEAARAAAVERANQARLASERRAANRAINQAQFEADRARSEAEQAKQQVEDYRVRIARSESELAQAKQRAEQAQTDAERAKAREEVARLEAERARLDRDQAIQRLQVSLSEILETRREARGLIVSLSDVLFDFNKATLKPGTKEKLSKLSGILLAYPGSFRLEIEGHTDSVGSDEYNQRLSEGRANSVRDYIVQAGIPANKIVATRGFGESKPVTTNDTPEGRQMNRRVEIIIADSEVASSLR